ncbi:ParA family protein [Pseudoclavibacter sp. Z016]|uniref:ParA family protein n=1 Tax=Pseudoclavibacter sp. Z016 TaxID=2080581 RepID=UPI0015E33BE3|nr:ParA family protein [Pseudoclavibacter sp. Z016]
MKKVAFFNHKGGVGKTTLVFNVGLALERMGYTVLFIDADAQTNLTSAAIDVDQYEDLLGAQQTIYGALLPIINNVGDFDPVEPVKIRDRAYILPGDIRLSAFEEILPQAWTEALAGQYRGFQISTAMFRLASRLGESVSADFVLFDLGPNVGALNRTILIGCDGFVVPLSPDLFSLTALPSVGASTTRWIMDWDAALGAAKRARLELSIDLPGGRPSPLGYVSQQFVTYRKRPAAAFRRWSDKIPSAYQKGILEPMRDDAHVPIPDGPALLGEVKNLSSLIPIAQQNNRAIFELGGAQARGAQYTRAQDTLELFTNIASGIIAGTSQ